MGVDLVPHLPSTIAALPLFVAGRYPDSDLLARCRADGVTWTRGRDLVPIVRDISLGLTSLGMAPGDRVAMVCESRPEWVLTDFAILCAGAASASVYPTLAPEQVAYIVRDCGASIVVVSTAQQLDKVLSVTASVPALKTL